MARDLITIVMPAYNEELNLPFLFDRVTKVVNSCPDYDWELLLIDNCSEDKTGEVAKCFVEKDPRWRYIRFSRNFGFETSIAAGTYYAKGDALIYLSTDLQDPPELIPNILKQWKAEKVDVVYGVLKARRDSTFLKTLGAKIAYRMIRAMSDISIPVNATDFRLITRPVIEALNRCGERNRYMRGMIHWVGFRHSSFTYDRAERVYGESHAGLIFCINFAITAIMAFSYSPLRWASLLGMLVTAFSMLAGLFYIGLRILDHMGMNPISSPPPAGWATQVLLILFFGGVQCLFLGIIGEYLGRVFNEVKNRPLWVIRETEGYKDQQNPLKVNP
jgi:glycosyltransferase involved in cell wall biosynthesis